MPVETKEKDIDGSRVTVTQFPALTALALKSKLLKFCGDSLAKILMMEGDLVEGVLPYDRIEAALAILCNKIEPKQFEDLVLEILRCTRVDGIELNRAGFSVFDGRLLFMYKCIAFSLEANYGDFFGAGGFGSMFRMGKAGTSAEPPSAESTGSSTPSSPDSGNE